jgi:putative membrane protein
VIVSAAFPAWHVHPDVLIVMGLLGGAYVWALRRLGPRFVPSDERPVSKAQALSWWSGLLVLLVATTWPIHDLAEGYLFSVHMVQHTLISLVAPPLLLLGMPAWLLRWLVAPRMVNAVVRRLTRPFVALVLFNGVILFTHWPAVVELTLRHHPVHLIAHVVLFGAASVMWWPVISPLPEMPGLSYPGRMLYLFLQSIAPTVPASFLTFGRTVIYPFYEAAPRLWGISPLTDQLVAGLIMKLVGGLILWVAIAVVFFKWFSAEQTEGWDALRFGRVDHDIQAGLSRR